MVKLKKSEENKFLEIYLSAKEKKMIFSDFFPIAGNNGKYINTYYNENFFLNIFGANLEWATAHLYCKKKKYCIAT